MSLPGDVDRICVHCGKVVARDRQRLCDHCGLAFAPEGDPYDALVAANPSTIVRTYRGNQQSDVAPAFRRDADILAGRGYTPTSQSWAHEGGSDLDNSALITVVERTTRALDAGREGAAQ